MYMCGVLPHNLARINSQKENGQVHPHTGGGVPGDVLRELLSTSLLPCTQQVCRSCVPGFHRSPHCSHVRRRCCRPLQQNRVEPGHYVHVFLHWLGSPERDLHHQAGQAMAACWLETDNLAHPYCERNQPPPCLTHWQRWFTPNPCNSANLQGLHPPLCVLSPLLRSYHLPPTSCILPIPPPLGCWAPAPVCSLVESLNT